MIRIAHLYYDLMNLYGENGNIKAIQSQLNNQNVKFKTDFLTIGDEINFDNYDVIYIGSGTSANLELVLKDIQKYAKDIQKYVDNNKFLLATGNAIELFGQYIKLTNNKKISALQLFDFYCEQSDIRFVSETIAKTKLCKDLIIGFQNQQGIIKNISDPLFEVIDGIGSYPNSHSEGVMFKNFIGTYLIGPILVRNPELLKYCIKNIVMNSFKNFKFKPYNLALEKKAHDEYLVIREQSIQGK